MKSFQEWQILKLNSIYLSFEFYDENELGKLTLLVAYDILIISA
jgi:hypothetical protein